VTKNKTTLVHKLTYLVVFLPQNNNISGRPNKKNDLINIILDWSQSEHLFSGCAKVDFYIRKYYEDNQRTSTMYKGAYV